MKIGHLSEGQVLRLIYPLSMEAFLYAAKHLRVALLTLLKRQLALRLLHGNKDFPDQEKWIARCEADIRKGGKIWDAAQDELVEAAKAFVGPPTDHPVKYPEVWVVLGHTQQELTQRVKTSFEEMMKTFPTLYKRTSTGKIQTWKIGVEQTSRGGRKVITQGLLDGKKQTYKEDVVVGKNEGKKNATTAFQQAELEAEAEWRKKQERNHYGLDAGAEESAGKRAEAPMLAEKYPDHYKKVDWDYAYAQPKLDGNRCLARMDDNKSVTLWTRKGVQIVTLDHLAGELQGVMDPNETFDGELYIHGMHVTNLRSFLTRKQEGCENVSFRIYDVFSPAPFWERHDRLLDTELSTDKPSNGLALVPTIKVMNEKDLMKFQRDCIEEGFEGAMLRWGNVGYEAGKRSQGLLKVKTFDDAEFRIVNVVEGIGTFAGMAVLECRTKAGARFSVTAPGTHEQKREIWKNREDYLGKLVTVKYAGYTKTEAPVPFQPVAKEIHG